MNAIVSFAIGGVSGQSLLIGLSTAFGMGSVYALVALSFTLVNSATGYFHLGMGAFVTLGAVLAYKGAVSWELPWLVIFPGVMLIGAIVGGISETIAVRPIRGRTPNDNIAVVVSTLAFLIVTGEAIALWFGTEELRVPAYIDGPPFDMWGVPVRRVFVVMTATLVVVAIAFEVAMRKTDVGRILRASHDDPTGVELLGITFQRVVRLTFCLAGAFAALGGVLVAPVSFASPFVGANLLLYGFAAIAIGGFGSFAGALLGAFIVGLVTSISPLYVSTDLTRPIVLLVMVVVLLVRPTGLLGRRGLRAV